MSSPAKTQDQPVLQDGDALVILKRIRAVACGGKAWDILNAIDAEVAALSTPTAGVTGAKPAPDAMREALKPFAKLFETLEQFRNNRGGEWPGDDVEFIINTRTDKDRIDFTFGDLRRAYDALSPASVPSGDGATTREEIARHGRNYAASAVSACLAVADEIICAKGSAQDVESHDRT